MHLDCPVDFATPSHHAAQRQVSLEGLQGDLKGIYKGIDGFIGLLIEQIIQTAKIVIFDLASTKTDTPNVALGAQPPTQTNGHNNQKREKQLRHGLLSSATLAAFLTNFL